VVASGYKWGKGGTIAMFMGEYGHTIDAKGRIIVPAKFRESLGDNFIITKGLDNCLFVYTNEEWQRFEEKLKTLPLTNKNARTFTRFFLAGAACRIRQAGKNSYTICIKRVCFVTEGCSICRCWKQDRDME